MPLLPWAQTGEWYDTHDDALRPRDPAVVAAMQARWPDLVPIRYWTQWESPSGAVETTWRHGVARYVPTPKNVLVLFGVARGPFFSGPAPNVLERIFEGPQLPDGRPGEYQPFDWQRLDELKRDDIGDRSVVDAVREWMAGREAERLAAKRAWMAEVNDFSRDMERYMKRKLAQISDAEWADAARKEVARSRGELRHEAKPYVFLG